MATRHTTFIGNILPSCQSYEIEFIIVGFMTFDFLIVRIFSFKRLYPYLLNIHPSESQANPSLHKEVVKILTPSHLANPGGPSSWSVLPSTTIV